MPELKYGSYTHPDSPAVAIRRDRRANPDGSDPWDHVAWTIKGMLSGYASQANLITARDALRSAYAANGNDLVLRQAAAGTILEQLDDSATLSGVRVTQAPALLDNFGPELLTLYHYEIVVEADVPATGSLTHYDEAYSTSYDLNERGLTSVTTRGRLRTPAGTSADALFASKDPGAPSALYHLASTSKQLDDIDTTLDWAYVYAEGPLAWPTGVYSPQVTESLDVDEEGRATRVISATMYGPSAKTQCRRLKRSDLRLLASSETETPYDHGFSVSYRYLDLDQSRELMAFTASIAVEAGGPDFKLHVACDGGDPVRQDTGRLPWRVAEQGSAVGRSRFPAVPAPAYGTRNLKAGSSITRSGPKRGADGRYSEYAVAWSRAYEFPRDPGLRNPSRS